VYHLAHEKKTLPWINDRMHTHQDWNEVVFRKQNTKPPAPKYEGSAVSRVERETDRLDHSRVGRSVGQKIRDARIAKGFATQSDLAKALNVRSDVIASYESGKAIPDVNLMQRMRRVLNTKL
jgi:ribosome-binding protein aMBF1 (putative translation factor)